MFLPSLKPNHDQPLLETAFGAVELRLETPADFGWHPLPSASSVNRTNPLTVPVLGALSANSSKPGALYRLRT